ncbi:hypothetical protein BJI67_07790 [Acidihalobacter aeolianus]|uniref:DUF1722 domain-containing protein n=1 Tax=Acidihalobacter aeolianus TaxID=2792603 RepID=A0A1D8K7M9_9GAMM|nr:DUF523 and DUF1722 domain-containing protein [Acidihalobacter aeolianus]AOV16979.1 hypothetical protein BJI67_07790 [Acidihalobacter aeolianus]
MTAPATSARPRIGISSCLLGRPVRHDGGHKRDAYLCEVLGSVFEWVPGCPETAIGLGIPRKPIHLRRFGERIRVVEVDDPAHDVTDALADEAARSLQTVVPLAGYVLKQGSPSCGLHGVRVHDREGTHPAREGRGGFAAELARLAPLLPLAEETQLHDPRQRQHFIWRALAYHRWQQLAEDGMRPRDLVDFHTRHKYLLMAHDQEAYRRLGPLVSQAGNSGSFKELSNNYIALFMSTMRNVASPGQHANALQHMAGYFSDSIEAHDRTELGEAIEAYRLAQLPLAMPVALLRHHLRRHPQTHLEQQLYLDPTAFI